MQLVSHLTKQPRHLFCDVGSGVALKIKHRYQLTHHGAHHVIVYVLQDWAHCLQTIAYQLFVFIFEVTLKFLHVEESESICFHQLSHFVLVAFEVPL